MAYKNGISAKEKAEMNLQKRRKESRVTPPASKFKRSPEEYGLRGEPGKYFSQDTLTPALERLREQTGASYTETYRRIYERECEETKEKTVITRTDKFHVDAKGNARQIDKNMEINSNGKEYGEEFEDNLTQTRHRKIPANQETLNEYLNGKENTQNGTDVAPERSANDEEEPAEIPLWMRFAGKLIFESGKFVAKAAMKHYLEGEKGEASGDESKR